MKHLPKHLRPRWRYVAVGLESWPDAAIDRGTFRHDLEAAARRLLGDPGCAELDLEVLSFAFDRGVGSAVVRVRRGEVDRARAAIACLSQGGDDPLGLQVLGVSGTVRGCEEKYIRRPPELADERQVVFEDAERRAIVRGNRYDVRVEDGFAGTTELDFS